MTVQLKQRIVGIGVLLFLGLIILPILFGHDPNTIKKPDEKNTSEIILANEKPINHQIPSDAEQHNFATERDIQPDVAAPSNPHNMNAPIKENIPLSSVQNQVPVATNRPNIASFKSQTGEKKTKDLENIENKIINRQQAVAYPTNREPADEENTVLTPQTLRTSSGNKPTNSKEPRKMKGVSLTKKTTAENVELDLPTLSKNHVSVADNHTKWNVQLGSFSNKSNAESLVRKLKSHGFKGYIKTSKNLDGQALTKVFVGPEVQRSKATETLEHLEKVLKLQGVVVKK